MYKLINIEGIGSKYAQVLKNAGIENQDDLLLACNSRAHRARLEKQTHISHKLIMKWTHQADLARIHGISEEYSELLDRVGVNSVPELAHRNPEHLHHALLEKNQASHLVRRVPGLTQVTNWVLEAKKLPRVVLH